MLDWVTKDGKLLLFARPMQSFSASFVSIFIAVYLSFLGLPLWQIGLVLTGGRLASTLFNMVAGFLADKVGRRRMLVFFGLIPVFAGVVYATMTNPYLLVPIAVVSTLGSRGGFGPVNMLEGVILAQACSDEKRTRLYAIRSTLNSVAVSAGSLFAGAIVLLQGRFSLSVGASYMWMFGIYALLNLLTVALYSPMRPKSRTRRRRLCLSRLRPGGTS